MTVMTREQVQVFLDEDYVSAERVVVEDLARTALDALARLADAEAAQALVVERAAEAAYEADSLEISLHGANGIAERIRAFAQASGVAALAALRAERDEWKRLAVAGELTARNLAIVQAERDALRARLAAAEGRVAARVKPLVFSEFRDGGCVGRPHSFQYFITQDHDGRFWCHHDTSQHDSLAKAQEHAQAHYQTAALAIVTPPADTGEGGK